jgi:BirA family biotin operon repressor/biotin-[acetyl-CoA-carboxylase] ligase
VADTFVEQVLTHDEIASTNDAALALATTHASSQPLLISARRQTAGRGRGTHAWWSADGALMFSLLLTPAAHRLDRQRMPQVSLVAALATADVLTELAPSHSVQVKWPNDVFLAGHKVCGILAEVPANALGSAQRMVLGLGLNVNNSFAAAPRELREIATSLVDTTATPHELSSVLIAWLRHFEDRLGALAQGDGGRLVDDWAQRCLLTGRHVELTLGARTVAGLCRGIDRTGHLLLEIGGQLQAFAGGTIAGYRDLPIST